jgi:hypothetical protein
LGFVSREATVAKARAKTSTLAVSPAQVIAFRLERLGLRKRARDVAAAVGEIGLPDFPPGAALAATSPRLATPSPSALEEALDARALVRLRAMRGAPVVARADDYDVFASGVLPRDEPSMRAFIGPAAKSVDDASMSAMEAVDLVTYEAARALSQQALDRDALHAELRSRLPQGLLPFCRNCESHHVHPSLLYAAALRGRFVIFPRGEGPYLVARADQWLPQRERTAKANEQAPLELLRRFLRAYGPANVGDFADWAGIGGGQPQAIWSELEAELTPVEVKAPKHATRFILASDRKKLTAAEVPKTQVRLLSPGDPLLQMRDRPLLVPDAKLEQVIWKNLAPTGVVLVGTDVAGIARAQKKKNTLTISIEPLSKLTTKLRASVEEEASRIAEARGVPELKVSWSEN